jgi:hypothetical protein
MALTIANLALDFAPNASGTTAMYTVPANKSAIIKTVILYATGSSADVKILAHISGSTAVQISKKVTMPATARLTLTDEITLGAGDALEVNVSAAPGANSLQYAVCGLERDV